jgi:DNA-binding IclR family transcriptional regulator
MALLLLFEKSDSLSYRELHATTKISDDQFPRYVQSLLEAKLLNCNTEVWSFGTLKFDFVKV